MINNSLTYLQSLPFSPEMGNIEQNMVLKEKQITGLYISEASPWPYCCRYPAALALMISPVSLEVLMHISNLIFYPVGTVTGVPATAM